MFLCCSDNFDIRYHFYTISENFELEYKEFKEKISHVSFSSYKISGYILSTVFMT